MKKNLLDFFHPKLQKSADVKSKGSDIKQHSFNTKKMVNFETPPTPATPCTPLTPQTPLSSSSSSSSSSSPDSSSSGTTTTTRRDDETPLTTTPQTPVTPSSSSSKSQTPTESHDYDVTIDTTTKKKEEKSSSSSSSSQCSNRQRTTKKKQQQQLYLDFGQASFGSRTICPICHTLVVHGITEDEIQHEKICKEFQMGVAVSSTLLKHFRIVANDVTSGHLNRKKYDRGGGCIVEVRPTDCLTWRRKVLQVRRIVEQKLGFVGASSSSSSSSSSSFLPKLQGAGKRKREPMFGTIMEKEKDGRSTHSHDDDDNACSLGNKTVYLYIMDQRIVGYCSVEIISQAFEMYLHSTKTTVEPPITTSSKDKTIESGTCCHGTITRSMKPSKAILGVHQLWCHELHRQKGISTRLVDAARSKCIFGMTVPPYWVAFSSPTWDGARFAKKYSHPHVPLVYEMI